MSSIASIGAPMAPDAIDPAVIAHGRTVIDYEIEGLRQLSAMLDTSFARAVALLAGLSGRIVLTGVGKSGHIARKIASTFASTGAPALFLHPLEAAHGDLGAMAGGDALIAISNSGETVELMPVVAHARAIGVAVIAVAGSVTSRLARAADIVLLLPQAPEACAHGMAPTTSTTASLALGDALAVTLMRARGFSRAAFAALHPGGPMGMRAASVGSLLHGGGRMPLVGEAASLADVLGEIGAKGFGVTGVVDGAGRLVGAITDGDLRRAHGRGALDAGALMHRAPRTVPPEASLEDALGVLRAHRITSLFVMDEEARPLGLVHIHDFLRAGLG